LDHSLPYITHRPNAAPWVEWRQRWPAPSPASARRELDAAAALWRQHVATAPPPQPPAQKPMRLAT
jgi:hypothetical protein